MASQDLNMQFDNDEISGEFERGELMDFTAAECVELSRSDSLLGTAHSTGGSSGAIEQPQNVDSEEDIIKNAFGRGERKKTSIVHKEMTIEKFPDGTSKRKCNWCGSLFKIDEASKSTSAARRHLKTCLRKKAALNVSGRKVRQTVIGATTYNGDNSAETWQYDHAKVRELAAHVVLGHEFPFSLMEGVILNKLLKAIYPWYKRITRHTVKTDCESFFKGEKLKMKLAMSKVNRVSLTTDLWWSSEQKIGYMTVTGHFIDAKWQLHKRVLSFINVPPPHTGEVLARELIKVMEDWRIKEKVVSISVDNASANDNCLKRLKEDFTGKKNLLLDGKLFHVRCCAHILNLLVQDGLGVIKEVVDSIRGGVKYLLSSEKRCKEFEKIVRVLELDGKLQVLDTKTRWNSTWLMLSTACFYKSVWPRYAEEDASFAHFLPSEADWEIVEDICKFLEVFADVTEIISGSYYPTVNLFLSELWRVKNLLEEAIENVEKPYLHIMAREMKLKYDKYWSQCDLLISIGVILDPRYKMVFINWVYPEMYGSDANANFETLSRSLNTVFLEYEESFKRSNVGFVPSKTSVGSQNVSRFGKGKKSFETYLDSVEQFGNSKSDLDLYLEEPVFKVPAGTKFDALEWWRINEAKYPVLSKMAKDLLSIPITTVASEATFSAGKRIIDAKRASMNVDTVEMLLCGGDWVKEIHGIKKGKTILHDEEPDWELEYCFSNLILEETAATSKSGLSGASNNGASKT